MRILKITLVLLLVLVTGLFAVTSVIGLLSDSDVPPVIRCDQDTLEFSVKQPQSDLLSGITASDQQDGDLTDRVIIGSISKLINKDTAKVTYLVFDSDDNMASLTRYVRYSDYRRPVLDIKEPLVFVSKEAAELIARLKATDVIDGDISELIRISTLSNTDRENIFSVAAQVTNSMGDTVQVKLPVILADMNAARPDIRLNHYLVYLNRNAAFNPLVYLDSVYLAGQPMDISSVSISHQVDTSTPGTYWVYYNYLTNTNETSAILTVVVE